MRAPHTERLEQPQLVGKKGRLAPEQTGSAGLTYEDMINVNQSDSCPFQYTAGGRFLKNQDPATRGYHRFRGGEGPRTAESPPVHLGVRHFLIGIQISNPPFPVLGSNSAP